VIQPWVLVAADRADAVDALRRLLDDDYRVEGATGAAALQRAVDGRRFDVIVADVGLAARHPERSEGSQASPNVDDILRCAQDDGTTLLFTADTGAPDHGHDVIRRPFDNARLRRLVRAQIASGQALRALRQRESETPPLLIAESPAMAAAAELIARAGATEASVLITGERGTGRAHVAATLHAASRRAHGPLVRARAAGLPELLFDAELFGAAAGAFLGSDGERIGRVEAADGGTLFIDEWADLTRRQQARLLRVVETGELERIGSPQVRRVDIRLVAATATVTDHDAGTVEIRLPPLRERAEDLPALARHFVRKHAAHFRKRVEGIDDRAVRALAGYHWPGNVGELEAVLARAVLACAGEVVTTTDLAIYSGDNRRLEQLPLEEVEYLLIRHALKRFGGNVSRAAVALGLSRSALYRRLQRFGL
jgi:DNA-binding NtrC family response regulator